MKILYVSYRDENGKIYSGVEKKISGQIKAFRDMGLDVEESALCFENKFKRIIPFQTSSIPWNKVEVNDDIDGLYIRYQLSDYQFLKFLRKIKKKKPNIKIVVEIPTYPYDGERKNRYKDLRDKIYREYLYKYVNYIAVISDGTIKTIFNIPIISIINGIDCDSITVKKNLQTVNEKELHFGYVGGLAYWHGIDRMLLGMAEYKKKHTDKAIYLHIAGDGGLKKEFENIVVESNLTDNVIFEGRLRDADLDELYNKCQIAVSSLALHRSGLVFGSVLKSREYLAKGIPFIYAAEMDVFQTAPVDFAFQCPADDSAVDIEAVLDFYYNLLEKESVEDLKKRIRNYAETYVDMKRAMREVITYYIKETN